MLESYWSPNQNSSNLVNGGVPRIRQAHRMVGFLNSLYSAGFEPICYCLHEQIFIGYCAQIEKEAMTDNFDQEPAGFTRHSDGGEIVTSYGIGKWLMTGREEGATHMIVVCDTWDHEDFPVFVMPDQDVHEVEAGYRADSMNRVVEVYWLEGDLNQQLGLHRSFTYGPGDGNVPE